MFIVVMLREDYMHLLLNAVSYGSEQKKQQVIYNF